MARYQVTFDMPVRLAAGDRAMAIAGRLDEALQGLAARGVTDPELATHRVRRTRLRSVTVTMTVRAADAAKALSLAFEALRSALGRDVRAWDVPGTGVTVVPVTPRPAPRPTVADIRAARARAARTGLVCAECLLCQSDASSSSCGRRHPARSGRAAGSG